MTTIATTTHLRQLAPDLWVATMPFSKAGLELGARMTVVRLSDGGLFVHSPIALDEAIKRDVQGMGPVKFIVSPFRYHYAHLAEWAQAYPEAQVWGPPGLDSATAKTRLFDSLDETPRAAWADVLDQTIVQGNSLDNEVVFFHRSSRTLIATDLCFNIPSRNASLTTKMAAKALGVLDNFSPTRLSKKAVNDRNALRGSLRTMLDWDFDRIIISHGDIVERNGKAKLRQAFKWLYEN